MKYEGIEEIIKASKFRIHPGEYVYAKAESIPDPSDCFLVSVDENEITAVLEKKSLDKIHLAERNKEDYCLIELIVSVPFYSVGLLATVSSAVADGGMNILIVSTYSKDYILVREEHTEKTRRVLLDLGFRELGND